MNKFTKIQKIFLILYSIFHFVLMLYLSHFLDLHWGICIDPNDTACKERGTLVRMFAGYGFIFYFLMKVPLILIDHIFIIFKMSPPFLTDLNSSFTNVVYLLNAFLYGFMFLSIYKSLKNLKKG